MTVNVEVPMDNLQSKKKEPQRFIFSSPGFLTIREKKEEQQEQQEEDAENDANENDENDEDE